MNINVLILVIRLEMNFLHFYCPYIINDVECVFIASVYDSLSVV